MARTSKTQDEKNKFIFFQTFYTQAMSIKNIECREHFFRTIAEYGLYGKTPDFSKYDPSGLGLLDGMFEPIKFLIDQNHEKYEKTCEERKEAGKKGGNKNFQKGKPNPYYAKKKTTEKDNQMDIKDNPNNKNKNKNESVLYSSHPLTIEERKKNFENEIRAVKDFESYKKVDLRKFYNYWTELNKDGTLMRFEEEEFWEAEKRLRKWVECERSYGI